MRGMGRIVLLSWGLFIMRGTGLEQWSGETNRNHGVGRWFKAVVTSYGHERS